ncbi:hypothetical protein ACPVPU_03225 [Sphingomonas sp. CJ99]
MGIGRALCIAGILWIGATSAAAAQTSPVTLEQARASLAGMWQGKLEYRDYQADRWFGLPVVVAVEQGRDGLTLIRKADFDDGPKTGIITITSISLLDPATGAEQSASFRKGRQAELIVDRLTLTRAEAADRWTIVATREGRDNDRPASIRETTTRDGPVVVTLKEVDFTDDDGSAWLVRNRTTLTRK